MNARVRVNGYYNSKIILYFTKTACTLLPYSILDLIKVDTTYLRTVILTASVLSLFTVIIYSLSAMNEV